MQRLEYGQHIHHTKFVPQTKLQELWVEEKEKNPNTIILVKLGKFYELFNEDADIFHNKFAFMYMVGNIAHTGYPETYHDKYCELLTKNGLEFTILDVKKAARV